jgi:hypothetical protein
MASKLLKKLLRFSESTLSGTLNPSREFMILLKHQLEKCLTNLLSKRKLKILIVSP